MLSSYRSKLLNTLKKLLDMDKSIASVGNRRTPKSRRLGDMSAERGAEDTEEPTPERCVG